MSTRRRVVFVMVQALLGLIVSSCTTGTLYRGHAEADEVYSPSRSDELLMEIEEFRESLRQQTEEAKGHPVRAASEGAETTGVLELKASGPGTGVEAENVPTILETLQLAEPTPAPPPSAEPAAAPAAPIYIVERQPPTIGEIAAEIESRSSANPRFKRALAALYLATGDAEGAFLAATSLEGHEEHWETLIKAAASFRIGETDAAISLADEVLREWKRQSPLRITKLALCKRISSYGVFEEYDRESVAPKQEALLYCEVDNFVTDEEDDGTHVSKLHVRIEIQDAGRAIWSWDPPRVVDRSRNIRDDLYIGTRFYVPSDLESGEYTLLVTVRDEVGNKSAKEETSLIVKSP